MKTGDEKQIIKKIKQGDVGAYSILIDKYRHMVYTLALQVLKNEPVAEEVAQDTFFKAYKALDSFEGRSAFSTWIYRIAYRQAISRLRKTKNREVSFNETTFHPEESQNPGDILFEGDRSKFLKEALKRLKGDEATILTLYYYEDKKVDEIAEITGLSAANVKIKLFRGRQNLHKMLQSILNKEVDSLI